MTRQAVADQELQPSGYRDVPRTLDSYPLGSLSINAAASPLRGSEGFGYRRRCGRKASNMFIMSYIGDQVWLITSRQTDPDLTTSQLLASCIYPVSSPACVFPYVVLAPCWGVQGRAYSSSMFGWNMRFVKPMLGDL